MTIILQPLAAGFLVALFSFVGAFSLFLKEYQVKKLSGIWLSLAVGVMLSAAFYHMIPESIEKLNSINNALSLIMLGILLFFLLEKVIRWQHGSAESFGMASSPIVQMNLYGDAVHNFIDGIIVAAAFMHSPETGWITTLAIILHEIPQELGDIGALIYGGLKPARALFLNFICALTILGGIVSAYIMQSFFSSLLNFMLPVAAGGLIYISMVNIIPELHKEKSIKLSSTQFVALLTGLLFFQLVGMLNHTH
jgi:zinc and cadmium transporter